MLITDHFPLPLLAAADIGQAVIVIVALVVGFIQWLIKLMKEKAEVAERESPEVRYHLTRHG